MMFLRKAINWAVERYYPNSMFFGQQAFDVFNETNDGHLATSCLGAIFKRISDINADSFEASLEGFTFSGRDMGDWEISVKQTRKGIDFPKSLNLADGDKIISLTKIYDHKNGDQVVTVSKSQEAAQ